MGSATQIGDYLIRQLYERGVRHVFGVPGDFILRFFDMLAKSDLQTINTCDEQGAGFAADAYARLRGLGAVCVTYGVGGLKVVNTTAQAFAEESPVVVISGAPGLHEREIHPLLHHKARDFDSQKRVFEQVTVASAVLDNAHTALGEIDRVLMAAERHRRPVYIEIPRDMVAEPCEHHHSPPPPAEQSDPETLQAALEEACAMVRRAKQPVILGGVELHRFGLQDALLELVRRTNIPVATTLLGKSVVGENSPFYIGLYQGRLCREEVRDYVESSDCVLLLGVMLTDMDLGIYTARLERSRCIHAVREKLAIGYHTYESVRLEDFIRRLAAADLREPASTAAPAAGEPISTAAPAAGEPISTAAPAAGGPAGAPDEPEARPLPRPRSPAPPSSGDGPITVEALFARLNAFLTDETIVVADTGDALFGAEDLVIHGSAEFLAPAYYASLGFAVPGSIGAQLARPDHRPLVLVGDGAFQMTGMELSTIVRYGLNPIVVVLNNGGYVTERYILDGPFNDLLPWDYSRLPEVLGAGEGFVVRTAGDLDRALQAAAQKTDRFCLLDVRLEKMDASPALRRLGEQLGRQ